MNKYKATRLSKRALALTITVITVLLSMVTVASAESNSLLTLGATTRLAYQAPGETTKSGDDYSLHVGMRLELLYLFGAEIEYTPVPARLEGDIYRPSMRLTGHLHLLNFEQFDLYLGAGLAGDEISHLVDIEGQSTVMRVGGGFEIIPDGHWSIGVDGYWNVAGLGYYNEGLSDSLSQGGDIPDPRDQIKPGMIELGLALRYYL